MAAEVGFAVELLALIPLSERRACPQKRMRDMARCSFGCDREEMNAPLLLLLPMCHSDG